MSARIRKMHDNKDKDDRRRRRGTKTWINVRIRMLRPAPLVAGID